MKGAPFQSLNLFSKPEPGDTVAGFPWNMGKIEGIYLGYYNPSFIIQTAEKPIGILGDADGEYLPVVIRKATPQKREAAKQLLARISDPERGQLANPSLVASVKKLFHRNFG